MTNFIFKGHFLLMIVNMWIKISPPANFQPDPKSGSMKRHFGVSGHFCHIRKNNQISKVGFEIYDKNYL